MTQARTSGPPPGSLETPTLTALRELLTAARKVSPAVARRVGLSDFELDALEHLISEPIGPAELARRLGVTSAASSGIVDRLAARGHVVRRPHASDGRRTQVLITDSGRTEVLAQLAPMFAGLAALDARLAPEERVVVERFLREATAAVSRVL
jgi:DNA-binding MarR family transcriptional regulator